MFKINRRSQSCSKTITHRSVNSLKKNQQTLNKSILNKSFKDFGKQVNNLSTQKLNSYKRLTKQNIKELQIKRINAHNDFNKALNNSIEKQQLANNQLVYRNSVLPPIPKHIPNSNKNEQNNTELPKIPNYIPNSNKNDQIKTDIEKLPKRVIETQEDMANLFNQIMNGTGQIPTINQNGQIEYNKQKKENIEQVNSLNIQQTQQKKIVTISDIQDKIPELLQQLETKIITNKHINYLKYIELIIDLKNKFQKNNMIKSIIHKSIQKLNNQQFFKIPSDKLKELIQIVYKYLI